MTFSVSFIHVTIYTRRVKLGQFFKMGAGYICVVYLCDIDPFSVSDLSILDHVVLLNKDKLDGMYKMFSCRMLSVFRVFICVFRCISVSRRISVFIVTLLGPN